MTDKDLRHLSRAELLDILYEQQKRYEDSLAENQALRQQLEDRTLRIASAGSIAEAAIQVNGVFEAAQAAADQYLASVKAATADMVQKTDEAQRQREAILQDAKQQADKIVQDAQAQAARLLTESAAQIDEHVVHIAPAHVRPELLDRAADDRAAPDDGIRLVGQQQIDGHDLNALGRLSGEHTVVTAHDLLVQAKGSGDGRAGDICIENGCFVPQLLHGDGQHRRDGRFADAAFAGDDCNDLFDI